VFIGFDEGVITIEVTLSPSGKSAVMTIACGASSGGVTIGDYDEAVSGSTLCHDAKDDLG
jgi:hypothetical protein